VPFFLVVLLSMLPLTSLDRDERGFIVKISASDQYMRECVQLGLALRFQFIAQVCHKRALWFDDCARERKAIATLTFDPITGQYQVERDLYDDGLVPLQRNFGDLNEAFSFAASSLEFTEKHLAAGQNRFRISKLSPNSDSLTLHYKSIAFCQQNFNHTIDRIARLLTLGWIRLERYESDWQEVEVP
jgi:hypothetical protein